jgi:hypothetical protein
MAVEGQEQLPGVEPSTPVLRYNSFETHKLTTAHEGWTLAVDDGIDDTQPMVFGGCKVDKFSVEAKQGGSIVLRLRVGTSDVDADKLGKLAMHNGQSIWITLKAPEKKPDAIDGTQAAFQADHPDAGSLFAAEHGEGGTEGGEGGTEGGEGGTEEPGPETNTPEGETDPVGVRSSKRTARGREATKKALAEGLAASGAAQ